MLILVIMLLMYTCKDIAGVKGPAMDKKKFVGNVVGMVFDKQTKLPINGAEVYLLM